MASYLRVSEIFNSISGEVSPQVQGCFCTFVRFYGCNLSCPYCDTKQSDQTYFEVTLYDLPNLIDAKYKHTGKLCITGGEPLLQIEGVEEIVRIFKNVWIETNGSCDFSDFVSKCGIVADYKTDVFATKVPLYFYKLKTTDWVKFVILNREQFEIAREVQKILSIGGKAPKFAYSSVYDYLPYNTLAKWLQGEHLLPNTFLNVQIHKLINMK
jgi:7-carboxy-7-deazaguanine synthase